MLMENISYSWNLQNGQLWVLRNFDLQTETDAVLDHFILPDFFLLS